MKPFLTRWLVTTLAVLVVSHLPGLGVHAEGWAPLLKAGLLLGILNAFVRPALLLLSLPLIVLSMGLFFFVVNALTLWMVGGLIHGFHVESFASAVFGSIVISLVSWALGFFFKGNETRVCIAREEPPPPREPELKTVRGRVIE